MIKNLHFWAAVAAYSIWGTFPLFLKQLSGFPAYTILFYRILFAAILGMTIAAIFMRKTMYREWQLWKEKALPTRMKVIAVMTGGGILLSVNWLLYIYVVNTINIQSASFAYMLCPILTAVLGSVVLKERLFAHHRIAIALGGISCIVLAFAEPGNTLFSLTIALSYALYLIIQKYADGINRLLLLSVQMLFSIVIISLTLSTAGISTPPHSYVLSMTAMMALVFTLLPLLLNLYSLQGLSSGTVGFLMYINPLLNFVIAFVFFHEKSSPAHIAAYALVVAAIVFFNKERFR